MRERVSREEAGTVQVEEEQDPLIYQDLLTLESGGGRLKNRYSRKQASQSLKVGGDQQGIEKMFLECHESKWQTMTLEGKHGADQIGDCGHG